jgi:type IV secretory pathway VirJ component
MLKKSIYLGFFLALSMQILGNSIDTLRYNIFGRIIIYHPSENIKSVALFVSGDSGWDKSMRTMAEDLVKEGAMVVGIDIRLYLSNCKKLKAACYYPAADFESLSLMIQKKYKIKQYFKPVLIGYSAGASLIYGSLVQAPANTFKGAIALSFCPDMEIDRPLCRGNGLTYYTLTPGKLFYLEPFDNLTAPFIVLHGKNDQVCSSYASEKFMNGMHFGELILLPNVGHGFSVKSNWIPQFLVAYKKILDSPSFSEQKSQQNTLLQNQHLQPYKGNLTLTILPVAKSDSLPIAFVISGDGGWTSFDQSFSEKLNSYGLPVIGLDAQKYFWNEKTPEQTTNDIVIALKSYMEQWDRKSFVLIGYSFGADIVPFVANLLPVGFKSNFKGVFSLSPDDEGDFEIHVSDMLNLGSFHNNYNVASEMGNVKGVPKVCIFGATENSDITQLFEKKGAKVLILPGSHHYNNDFKALAESIVKSLILK